MKCSLCAYEYDEDESMMECKGCLFFGGCNMVRCPNCGFEVPAEPSLVKALKKWRRKVIESK